MRITLLLAMAIGASFVGSNCGGSGVGDPCTPEDEYLTAFSGFSQSEVNVESRSFQCLTRVCLVNHFQGRVSCPYGQIEDPDAEDSGLATCMGTEEHRNSDECLPGGQLHMSSCQVPNRDGALWEDRIVVPVEPQLQERQADDAVYCSCRCAPPEGAEDDNASYCDCPSGFDCQELVEDLGFGSAQLAGSYCVKENEKFDPGFPATTPCSAGDANCDKKFNIDVRGIQVGRNQNDGACLPHGATCGKGDTCCATSVATCVDKNSGSGSINCNGTCIDANRCDHNEEGESDPSKIETLHDVQRNECNEGDVCP